MRNATLNTENMQLGFELEPERTWGGARDGAGRNTLKGRHDADHRRRPDVSPNVPMHVVLRTRPDVPRLRQRSMYQAIRKALRLTIHRSAGFRVVHTSIQHNHLHFLVEGEHRDCVTRGMQALAISAARAINRACDRTGKVFAYRYHATRITSPRQMRNALAYVLNNWRRHREDRSHARAQRALVDPYSTGIWFTGWTGMEYELFEIPRGYEPLPAANGVSWLLTIGWRQHGLVDPRERPGPLRRN
jgi:REP element-mobilizing transposase RayT